MVLHVDLESNASQVTASMANVLFLLGAIVTKTKIVASMASVFNRLVFNMKSVTRTKIAQTNMFVSNTNVYPESV